VVVADARDSLGVIPDVDERPGERRRAGVVPKHQQGERFVHDLVLRQIAGIAGDACEHARTFVIAARRANVCAQVVQQPIAIAHGASPR
jgi:hypothetical protein